ncbi:hypothetical protein [Pontibacillus yanchengensis]|uniref:Uncharacterized protein n=1 Tax=Pontibacillus yanchengensis Y32 TaxID=1385514 RepID=A0A0A2TET8_9BACI|nr:hypothetical protein [Pontibacillus yanchengensis]KGP74079.1 hypothetical protein N782_17235 [Pontibacillus yanchengensis Y32]
MTWTPETAYDAMKEIYTDDVMQEEKRRVFQQVYRHVYEHLEDLAAKDAVKQEVEDRMQLYKAYTFMPGDNLFQSMRYVFLLARGEKERDRAVTQQHLQRIYRALFSAAGLKNPVIPDSFWETPLGVSCLVADKGIEAVYPILDEMEIS